MSNTRSQLLISVSLRCCLALLLLGIGSSLLYAAPKSSKSKRMTEEEIRRYNIRRFDLHHLTVWGGVGYSALLHSNSTYNTGLNYQGDFSAKLLGGGGGLLGIGYEYNYKHWLVSVGPEFRIWSSADRLEWSAPYEVTNLDYNQTKRYYMSDAREQQVLGQVMLPMMVGGTWDKVYFKAGVKLGYTVLRTMKQTMDVQPAILDPEAYVEWQSDMQGHYNSVSQSVKNTGTNPFGLDIALSAEVGINLDQFLSAEWRANNEKREHPHRMRLALFADFGLNNMSLQGDEAMATTLTPEAIATQSWMRSEWGAKHLSSMIIGVKFSWLLQMNKIKPEKTLNGYLAIRTYDDSTLKPLAGVAVQVKNMTTKRENKRSTSSRGLISRREPKGDFLINAQYNGYDSIINMPYYHGEGNDTVQLAMHKIVVETIAPVEEDTIVPLPTVTEQPIVLENLFFATNKTTILPQSEEDLLRLYRLLSQHPEIRIRITGHTDNVGSIRSNQILSEGRANSVRQNMIERGIDPSRIEAEGKGELVPIDTNDTDEGRQNNRRVEFIIL